MSNFARGENDLYRQQLLRRQNDNTDAPNNYYYEEYLRDNWMVYLIIGALALLAALSILFVLLPIFRRLDQLEANAPGLSGNCTMCLVAGPPGIGKKGDKGDKGDKGNDGAAGMCIADPACGQGPPGDDGKDGKDGKNGINGLDGKDGKDGEKGDKGNPGKDGTDGTNGIDGADGECLCFEILSNLMPGNLTVIDDTEFQGPVTCTGMGAIDSSCLPSGLNCPNRPCDQQHRSLLISENSGIFPVGSPASPTLQVGKPGDPNGFSATESVLLGTVGVKNINTFNAYSITTEMSTLGVTTIESIGNMNILSTAASLFLTAPAGGAQAVLRGGGNVEVRSLSGGTVTVAADLSGNSLVLDNGGATTLSSVGTLTVQNTNNAGLVSVQSLNTGGNVQIVADDLATMISGGAATRVQNTGGGTVFIDSTAGSGDVSITAIDVAQMIGLNQFIGKGGTIEMEADTTTRILSMTSHTVESPLIILEDGSSVFQRTQQTTLLCDTGAPAAGKSTKFEQDVIIETGHSIIAEDAFLAVGPGLEICGNHIRSRTNTLMIQDDGIQVDFVDIKATLINSLNGFIDIGNVVNFRDTLQSTTGPVIIEDQLEVRFDADFQSNIKNTVGNLQFITQSVFTQTIIARVNILNDLGTLMLNDQVTITGQVDAQAGITNTIGNLLLVGPTEVSGTLSPQAGVVVSGDISLTGNLFDSSSATLTVDDSLQVEGNIGHTGNIFNSAGPTVTVNDDLHVLGDITATGACCTSDSRLKENVVPVMPQKALDVIRSLKPVTYNFIESFEKQHKMSNKTTLVGFIAQDVEKHIPQAVKKIHRKVGDLELSDSRILNKAEMNPYIVGAIHALMEKIETLEARIKTLQTKQKCD